MAYTEPMKNTKLREVFVFIAGATPQVITETIYALALKKPPVYPDEIFVVTTGKGRTIIEEMLIRRGTLEMLAKDCSMPKIVLRDSSFKIPAGKDSKLLDDIRTDEENEAMGDLILSLVRDKAADMGTRLHCSIAGGRKTMSFYLGSALQLFGRPWDKLYHVLVSPEFESHPEFFFKPKKDAILLKDGKKLNTKNAKITLAELPFIRLREKISLDSSSFSDLVKEGQKEIDMSLAHPLVTLNFQERCIEVGREKIRLIPAHLMIYAAYLRKKLTGCKHPDRPYCLDCTDCFPEIIELTTKTALEEMAKDYRLMSPSKAMDVLDKHKTGLSQEAVRQAISKIKKAIAGTLKDDVLVSYCSITTSSRGWANTRHGIRAEKEKIRIK
ncbi:MAG: TIGR02584 family CRISPR-associated protein [Nitrospirae bacterium]|nr:MAG: TIGR02584 family CRISPR-associated protein [Nitrospirota bacterium]